MLPPLTGGRGGFADGARGGYGGGGRGGGFGGGRGPGERSLSSQPASLNLQARATSSALDAIPLQLGFTAVHTDSPFSCPWATQLSHRRMSRVCLVQEGCCT